MSFTSEDGFEVPTSGRDFAQLIEAWAHNPVKAADVDALITRVVQLASTPRVFAQLKGDGALKQFARLLIALDHARQSMRELELILPTIETRH